MPPTSSTGEPLRGGARRDPERGASLLELLIALTLAAILAAAMVGAIGRRAPGAAEAAQQVVAALREARAEATRRGAPVRVAFDPVLRRIGRDEPDQPLPEGVALAVESAAETRDAKGRPAILFFPDGSSSGGVIALSGDRGADFRITVRWLTGQIRREVLPPEGAHET